MLKLSKEYLQKSIHIMGMNAVFMYNNGEEEASWRWLFMREAYKNLLKKSKKKK